MKPEEIELLIAQVKKGNQPAITQLYEQQKSYWFRICLRYAKNRDEAQDVFQDGVTKIFEKIDTFNAHKGSFNAWSNKVLVHEVLRSLKKESMAEFI
jgi:RNA polymerase sigma-70 factor (ECF subfamily)